MQSLTLSHKKLSKVSGQNLFILYMFYNYTVSQLIIQIIRWAAKSEEKKQAKAIAKEQRAANQAKKGSSLGESGTPGMTKSASSGEMTPVVKTKPRIKIKKATPSGDTNDASLDRKMPAKKMDGSDDDSDDSSDDDSSKPSSMASSSMKTPAKKSPKPKSSTGSPATSRKRNGKPTYLEMVHEAIVTMKDRTGSSGTAISKWIAANHEFTKSTLDSNPNMFKSRMNQAIKLGIKDGRFMKIKGSYKISPEVSLLWFLIDDTNAFTVFLTGLMNNSGLRNKKKQVGPLRLGIGEPSKRWHK